MICLVHDLRDWPAHRTPAVYIVFSVLYKVGNRALDKREYLVIIRDSFVNSE